MLFENRTFAINFQGDVSPPESKFETEKFLPYLPCEGSEFFPTEVTPQDVLCWSPDFIQKSHF